MISNLSNQPNSFDASNAVLSGTARINTTPATVITFPVGNSGYTGWSVRNNNATQWIRVNFTITNSNVGETQLLIRPGNTASGSFDGDVITAMTIEVVVTPVAGVVTLAAGATVIGAVVGVVDVDFQLVNT